MSFVLLKGRRKFAAKCLSTVKWYIHTPASLESQEKACSLLSPKAGELLDWLVRNVYVKGERCKWTPALSVEQSSQHCFIGQWLHKQ